MKNVTKVEFKTGEVSLDADTVLEKAKDNYTSVLVIGWDKEGYLDVRSTNNLDQKDCLYLANMFSNKLLNGDYAPE
ncbi:MAG: hypothetical protein Unbinned706contig1000_51 [Prokaryotic dsDNA virus sp.]|nr:MAG: hypothetical protein Unbinned706contig1000_51 [Prokaryotic dsDNA virus sp.]|tara:strand:+ start:525 stop:752 length:228 start_codon:yes stop_codon:yes gene_type:complete